jgi:hypothetical protein
MSDPQIRLAPIRRSITVKASREKAFDVFTAGMSRWWPKQHSLVRQSPLKEVVIEPRAGGRWYERAEDGSECTWGAVRLWEPPGRVVLLWQISPDWAYDPAIETELEIRFSPTEDGRTQVELEHRGLEAYGERAEAMRQLFETPEAWGTTLRLFAEALQG